MSVDYRTNAEERIKLALRDPSAANALVTAQIAAAEATLYLAEQQRLANIIAWTTRDGHRPLAEMQNLITEGLGL